MKIFIDRNTCDCWEGACESCFGWHLLQLMETGELHPAACQISTQEDGEMAFTFHIHDRDGKDKELIITKDNWTEAYESWPKLLAKQNEDINIKG